MRGELVARLRSALAGGLARGRQLPARSLGERLHSDRRELIVRGTQLRARVHPATLAAQPLAVDQLRTRELGTKLGATQPNDRFAIGALGVLARSEQRPRAREHAQPPIAVADARRLGQPLQRLAGQPGLPGPGRRLDQLSKRPRGDVQLRRLLAGFSGRRQGLLVAAKTVVQDSRCPPAPLESHALPGS